MAVNFTPVKGSDFNGLLTKFPEQYRDKLKIYTGEELFYIYKLAMYKPKLKDGTVRSSGDAFFMGLKYKLFRWLKQPVAPVMYREDGSAYPSKPYRDGIHPAMWIKLGAKYKHQFNDFVIESLTHDMIDNLAKNINEKRITA